MFYSKSFSSVLTLIFAVWLIPLISQAGPPNIPFTSTGGITGPTTPITTPSKFCFISTVAGNGTSGFSGDGGPATASELKGPGEIAVDNKGNLYIVIIPGATVDDRSQVRKINGSTGIITTVLMDLSSTGGLSAGSPIAIDDEGNLYISPFPGCSVKKVEVSTGVITTIAGGWACGYSDDGGPASLAKLGDVLGIAVDHKGNIFISDGAGSRVRKVDAYTGNISTVWKEEMWPQKIAINNRGDLFIYNSNFCSVQKVDGSTGLLTTVAGNGTCGYSGDGGPATAAQLTVTGGMAFNNKDDLYFSDLSHRVRKIDGHTGVVTTVAGNGTEGYSGDGGFATAAQLGHYTGGVTVDNHQGILYISDFSNSRIRKVTCSTIERSNLLPLPQVQEGLMKVH